MKEVAALIEKLPAPAEVIKFLEDGGEYPVDKMNNVNITLEDIEIRRTKHENIEVETSNEMVVALNTAITPELYREGLAREFVNRVQNLRKASGFEVCDRITTRCDSDNRDLDVAIRTFGELIKLETLTRELSFGIISNDMHREQIEIDGFRAEIGIAKVL